jgi:hypothetical protein
MEECLPSSVAEEDEEAEEEGEETEEGEEEVFPAPTPSEILELNPKSAAWFSPRMLSHLHLFAPPVLGNGLLFFAARPPPECVGSLAKFGVSFGPAYMDKGYLCEAVVWKGTHFESKARARQCVDHDSLHINWPLPGTLSRHARRHRQVPVERLLVFTFMYAPPRWDLPPYHSQLDCHHLSGPVRRNLLLSNLEIQYHQKHLWFHNRRYT